MHSFIVAGLFVSMLLAPCIFAQCYGFFPLRIKVRWVRPPAAVKPVDPLLVAMRSRNNLRAGANIQTGIKLAPVPRQPQADFAPSYTDPESPARNLF